MYGSLNPGKWTAALERVSSLGINSGEPLVASGQIPSGGTFRFLLPAARCPVHGWLALDTDRPVPLTPVHTGAPFGGRQEPSTGGGPYKRR